MSAHHSGQFPCLDRKLLAKIFAKRLEIVTPQLIPADQTRFIRGHNSYNNERRLLNLIQYGAKMKEKALVVSLDAEKAFECIEWLYLFHVLESFGLGDNFIKWIRALYASVASVVTNGKRSADCSGLSMVTHSFRTGYRATSRGHSHRFLHQRHSDTDNAA